MDISLIAFMIFDAFLVFVVYRMDQNSNATNEKKTSHEVTDDDIKSIYKKGYQDALKNHDDK